jgi:hypothetical protein
VVGIEDGVAVVLGIYSQLWDSACSVGGASPRILIVVRSSKTFLFANGFLLLAVTFIPFPTAVLTEYLPTPQANIAVVFYCLANLIVTLGFIFWWQSTHWPTNLLSRSLPKSLERKVSIQLFSGFVIYALTALVSYWFAISGLVIVFSLEILWVIVAIGSEEDLLA